MIVPRDDIEQSSSNSDIRIPDRSTNNILKKSEYIIGTPISLNSSIKKDRGYGQLVLDHHEGIFNSQR